MSNWKKAYGWSGHILVSTDDTDGKPNHNVVAIPTDKFNAIVKDYEECELDERIEVNRLGIIDCDTILLACGCCFSEGFEHYGNVFEQAEARATPGPPAIDHDTEYLVAMKEIYGLDLPACRLMIGCSSEHP